MKIIGTICLWIMIVFLAVMFVVYPILMWVVEGDPKPLTITALIVISVIAIGRLLGLYD